MLLRLSVPRAAVTDSRRVDSAAAPVSSPELLYPASGPPPQTLSKNSSRVKPEFTSSIRGLRRQSGVYVVATGSCPREARPAAPAARPGSEGPNRLKERTPPPVRAAACVRRARARAPATARRRDRRGRARARAARPERRG